MHGSCTDESKPGLHHSCKSYGATSVADHEDLPPTQLLSSPALPSLHDTSATGMYTLQTWDHDAEIAYIYCTKDLTSAANY